MAATVGYQPTIDIDNKNPKPLDLSKIPKQPNPLSQTLALASFCPTANFKIQIQCQKGACILIQVNFVRTKIGLLKQITISMCPEVARKIKIA